MKLVPKLRFKEFREEWMKSKIGDDCKVLMCKRIFSDQTSASEEIPFYKIGTIGGKPDAFISKALFEEFRNKYNYPLKGEVLITCSGTVGKCIPFDGKDAYYQDSNIVWIDNPTLKIRNEYLFYILSNFDWGKLNSTTISRIYGSDLRNIVVKHPKSITEQQKIASFLSAIDEKIQQLTRKKKLLEQYKKGVMQQLFSGKLRFKNENGKAYPKWEEKRLGDVCTIKGRIGYRGYTVQDIVKKGEGAITLSPSNITDGKLDFSNSTYISWLKYEESPEIRVEVNDILLVKTGSTFGKSAFVRKLIEPATINPQLVILKESKLFPQFLAYSIYHSTIQKQIVATVGSGAVPNLSQESISNFLLPVPSTEEQQKIASFLSTIDSKIESVATQITQSQTFKKGLLQQMFV